MKHHNSKAELLLEQPADPEEWCSKGKGRPSFTTWPETIEVINHLQLHEVRCDHRAIGHSTRKPTVSYTDMKEVMVLQGMKQQEGEGLEWPLQLDQPEVLPTLAIATRKPPNRYKGRVVVCGTYADAKPEGSISVGGIRSTAIRAAVHLSTAKQWSIGTLDVTGAFLQALRRPHGKTTLAQPPSILQHMQLVQPGELWRVDCALYGLQESPSDWAARRDEGARNMRWTHQGSQRHLEETAEKHLWKIKNSNNETCGYMLVYVDDFLIAADPGEMKSLMAKIKQTWVCSDEEMVSKSSTTRFCGYEIQERERRWRFLAGTGWIPK